MKAALALTLATIAAGTAGAATSDVASLHWRSIGPFRGGRVLAVTGRAGRPAALLFRRGERRGVGDARRRAHLDADLR